jgi:hypothetical protein
MRDEVPPTLTDAHVKMVEEAHKEGKTIDAEFGLEKSGIAGTAPEKEEGMQFCPSLQVSARKQKFTILKHQ